MTLRNGCAGASDVLDGQVLRGAAAAVGGAARHVVLRGHVHDVELHERRKQIAAQHLALQASRRHREHAHVIFLSAPPFARPRGRLGGRDAAGLLAVVCPRAHWRLHRSVLALAALPPLTQHQHRVVQHALV
eukprot:CAMPEP_0181320680 /NCGR_PEP_ID=MMETSP1101-20121128/18257_1 /TAXON_ID=46948 /ORGANISM="Rhodomonas abbreviata, Strain Caron Lab Isolate" /LENGTH=131 /DNA_ID=CAMNT_0023428409 /DNA_START=172 /DNA_END=567 /DNA_ORIENTATION=-